MKSAQIFDANFYFSNPAVHILFIFLCYNTIGSGKEARFFSFRERQEAQAEPGSPKASLYCRKEFLTKKRSDFYA